MPDPIPHAYTYVAAAFALAVVGASLLLGKTLNGRASLDLAGRLRCIAVGVSALASLASTIVDDLALSPSTQLLQDGVLAVTYLSVVTVLLAADRIARRFEKPRQPDSAPGE